MRHGRSGDGAFCFAGVASSSFFFSSPSSSAPSSAPSAAFFSLVFTRTFTCATFTFRSRTTTGEDGGAFRIDSPMRIPGWLYEPLLGGWV